MSKFGPICIASLSDESSEDESLGYESEPSLCTPRKISFSDDKDKKYAISFSDDEDSVVDKKPVFTSTKNKTKVVENGNDGVEGVRESLIDKNMLCLFSDDKDSVVDKKPRRLK